MATYGNADLEPVLREIVMPTITKQYEEETNLLNRIGEGGEPINIRGVRLVARTNANPSHGYFSESGALPTPGKSKEIEMKVNFIREAVGFEFSGDFYDQVNSKESLIAGATEKMTEYTNTFKKKISRGLYGDGTGRLAIVNGIGSAPTITMYTTRAGGSLFGARKLDVNGRYQFYSSSGTAHVATTSVATVSSKTESSATVVFDGTASDIAQGDYVVDESSYNKAPFGLDCHINNDTGVYQGASRSTYPMLKADVYDNGGGSLTVAALNKRKVAAKYRVEGAEPNWVLITSPTQYELYSRQGFNLIRFQGGGGEFRGDFSSVKHGNSEWIQDVDCEDDTLYGVDFASLKKYMLMKLGIMNKDGLDVRMYFSNGAGSDKYTGWLGVKYNLGCVRPNGMFKIVNNSTTDGAVGYSSLG